MARKKDIEEIIIQPGQKEICLMSESVWIPPLRMAPRGSSTKEDLDGQNLEKIIKVFNNQY